MATVAQKLPIPLPVDGIRADLDPHLVPPTALTDARNWILRNGKMQVRPGLTAYGNALATRAMGYALYRTAGGNYVLVQGTTTGWHRYDSGTNLWVDLTEVGNPLTGSTLLQNVFRQFQKSGLNYLIGTNGKDIPKKWEGTAATYLDIGGSPPIAQCMCIVADRLLLGNLGIIGGHQKVDVSGFQDFDTGWGVTETAILVDTPGSIRAMQEFSASVAAIYKDDAIYLASGTTGLTPIRFDLLYAGIDGPGSPLTVVPLSSGLHIYLSKLGNLWLFDGNTLQPHPASNAVQALFDRLAQKGLSMRFQYFGVYHRSLQELRYWMRSTTASDPDLTLMINLQNNSVWVEIAPTLRFSAGIFAIDPEDGSERLFLGATTGQTYTMEGITDAGTAIAHSLETGMTPLGDQTRYKHVPELEHAFASSGSNQTLSVQLKTSISGEGHALTTARNLTVGAATTGPYTTPHAIDTRFLGLRISGSATNTVQWRGSTAGIVPRGLA